MEENKELAAMSHEELENMVTNLNKELAASKEAHAKLRESADTAWNMYSASQQKLEAVKGMLKGVLTLTV